MKDLSIICVGYRKKDGSFHYEYKHNINWIDLEVSDNLYISDTKQTICNEDGTIKDSYFIKKTTKALIYDELESLLVDIYYLRKHKKESEYEDKIKLKELKALKKYYEKYIDKQKLVAIMYMKETSKKMKELNKRSYTNKGFNKELVSSVYDEILSDIELQIKRINSKSKKYRTTKEERESFKKITQILKDDYDKQKILFKLKVEELKKRIEEYDSSFKDTSQLKNELQILKQNYQKRNLRNFREKAKTFLFENGIKVNDKH